MALPPLSEAERAFLEALEARGVRFLVIGILEAAIAVRDGSDRER